KARHCCSKPCLHTRKEREMSVLREEKTVRKTKLKRNDLNCTACGSAATKRLSAVYEQGISTNNGTSGSIRVSSKGRFSLSSGSGRSVRQSALSKKAEPPTMASIGTGIVYATV